MKILWGFLSCTILTIVNAHIVPVIPTDFTVGDEVLSEKSNQVADDYANAYIDFIKSGVESSEMKYLTKELLAARTNISWGKELDSAGPAEKFVACTTCRATVKVAARMFRDPNGEFNGPNKEADAKKAFLDICQKFNMQTQEVCAGIFDIHWPVLDFILQNTDIDARTFCGLIPISFCSVKQPEYNWVLNINNNGVIDLPKSDIPSKGDNDLKILHITDIHYDPEYKPGALAVCEEPLCCQRMPTGQANTDKLAGYWSDYNICDAPLHLVENALDHMRTTHKQIDYIYHTGDVIPHIGWKTTREGNKQILTEIDDLITKKFPKIPVYPCLGNHDAHPSDFFSPDNVPDNVSTRWLYEHVYKLWSKWLPESTKETILKGGYYTVTPRRGFRIISLNNLDCYLYNWWLYYNGTYATQQLEWLHETLLAAEAAGEYVHILTHVPTGESDCWVVWSREFNRLIERFHPIISGIFNGHTHQDELNVYYSSKGHPINVAWNAGSITTFVAKNPNYRIYDVEPQSLQIVDFENWTFNLTAANAYGADKAPEWFKLCHFSEDFTQDLSPAGLDALLEKMAEQPDLLRKYWRCKFTNADPIMEKGCNNECLKNHICALATSSANQKQRCHELQAKLEQNLTPETTSTPSTTETTPPGDDGASSIAALQIGTLFSAFFAIRFAF